MKEREQRNKIPNKIARDYFLRRCLITRVLCDETNTYKGMVYVKILEGRFKDYEGYTFAKRVHSIKNSSTP